MCGCLWKELGESPFTTCWPAIGLLNLKISRTRRPPALWWPPVLSCSGREGKVVIFEMKLWRTHVAFTHLPATSGGTTRACQFSSHWDARHRRHIQRQVVPLTGSSWSPFGPWQERGQGTESWGSSRGEDVRLWSPVVSSWQQTVRRKLDGARTEDLTKGRVDHYATIAGTLHGSNSCHPPQPRGWWKISPCSCETGTLNSKRVWSRCVSYPLHHSSEKSSTIP